MRARLVVTALVAALAAAPVQRARASDDPPPRTSSCESNPPPMKLAEWQRLLPVLRARATEKARGARFPLSRLETLARQAEICDVLFQLKTVARRRSLLVTGLLPGLALWLGARFQKRNGQWVLMDFTWGSVD
jgi:hypothetical protein